MAKQRIPEIIVGTGGGDLDSPAGNAHINPNAAGQGNAFGVPNLTFAHGYSFNYKSVLAGPGFDSSALTYSDSGSGTCH